MRATLGQFRKQAKGVTEDMRLQVALENATGRFRDGRETALRALPDAEALRDHLKQIRAATISNLAEHLETFERNAIQTGAKVHWARNAQEAARIVVDVARRHKVDLVTKSKSMATEEIHLNQALIGDGIRPIETDLGEWIIQLAEEPPSHIIAPAIHKTKEEVADLFWRELGREVPADIPTLTAEARLMLREKFLNAGMGISGGNIGVAETGSIVLVTNEGNGRMVTSLPPVHVAVMGIEKIAPTWDEASAWLALLARSATGQPLSIYTSVITGPARPEDPDGPQEVHIVLLDNNRSKYIGTKYEEILQCIRCGACLNICPVYREAGGHAYSSPYSGPIGAVVSPLLFGLRDYSGLPQASSLCGACLDVCPVRIDLPRMLLELRNDLVDQRILPWPERMLEHLAAWSLGSRRLFEFLSRFARWLKFSSLADRFMMVNLPSIAPRSFRELWGSGDLEDGA
jgi:L-lactate dehydrogenase complex protein LldF